MSHGNRPVTTPVPARPVAKAVTRTDTPSAGVILLVFVNRMVSRTEACVLPRDRIPAGDIRPTSIALDGSVSRKAIRQTLREMGWRGPRGDAAWLVIPSEEIYLHIEEFPTTDPDDATTMAEGWFKGMTELDPSEHILAAHVLHRGTSRTVCALAVFQRERLLRLFGFLEMLGISSARFVPDVVALWQVSPDAATDGFWGRIVRNETGPRMIAQVIQVKDGVIRAARQRFFQCDAVDERSLEGLNIELFPDEFGNGTRPAISWHVSSGASEPSPDAAEIGRLAGKGALVSFEPEPDFWKAQLRQRRNRRRLIAGLALAGAAYAIFLLFLVTLSVRQWREDRHLREATRSQEAAYRKAVDIRRQLVAVRASLDPASRALEVLRQIAECMPEGITLENFSFRFQESAKLRGISTQSDAVYDFVGKLRTLTPFKNAKVDSVGTNPSGGGVTWQVVIPFQPRKAEKGGAATP